MNQLELDKMLDRHEQWLKDERKAHPEWRADFKDMQLSSNDFRQSVLELAEFNNACLYNADMRYTTSVTYTHLTLPTIA